MQKLVEDFMREFSLQTGHEIRHMDLVSEVGELGKEIIKGSNYGKEGFVITPKTAEEMGDCLFSLPALCHELEIDSKTALKYALEKYRERFKKNAHIGSTRE